MMIRISRRTAFVLFLVAVTNPAFAVLTSNSGGKSSIPSETAQNIADQSAAAIEIVATATKLIEQEGAFDKTVGLLKGASENLTAIVADVENVIEKTSTEPLNLGEIEPPEIVNADSAGVPMQTAQAAVAFLQSNLESWPPSEREVYLFLLKETVRANSAVEFMAASAEVGDAAGVRVGYLLFQRYTYSAVAFSLFWDLVVAG